MKPDQVLDLWKWAKDAAEIYEDDMKFFQVMSVCRELAEARKEWTYLAGAMNDLGQWQSILDQMKDSQ